MKNFKRKKIRIIRILILVLLLTIGFKIYSFYIVNNKKVIPVNVEVNNNSEVEENVNLLILINNLNKIPDDYNVNLVMFQNYKVADILINDLKNMYNDAKNNNIYLEITSAYRTKSEQQEIYDNKVWEFEKNGSSYDLAVAMTERTVAKVGYSEHETGLAIDFSDTSNYNKKIKMWNWLNLNAYKYGFILRYPSGKKYITGIEYEPWHYRYVGKKNAIIIYESGKTLEEYLNVENYSDKRKLR